jgi:hypothetical protein
MRGDDREAPEMRVRKDYPLRVIRAIVDEVLTQPSRRFDTIRPRGPSLDYAQEAVATRGSRCCAL